jgi:hypothetical protein
VRVSGLQSENANADAAFMAVGLILFWPALFALAATKDRKDELAQLRGEHETVSVNIGERKCGQTAAPSPVAPVAPEDAARNTPPSSEVTRTITP